ncbi:MAG: bifunctional diaminohydroxyphosphoribosylaminopyrimidine deaminase/5-amino-6-(5-phosphoribosylamino)uracil reductase RibD [Actinomycetota bacterium]
MSSDPVEAMRQAIRLASRTHPHPNPRVGAVVVDPEGRVLSEGAHTGPGRAHAERVALEPLAGRSLPAGATLVVTLEPCDHHGRTPPCTDLIIESGIRHVVVGARDPDPRVTGEGIRRLKESGIDVQEGLLAQEIEEADPAYFHHRRHGRAHFLLKRAMTLDGQTAAADGSSRWITGPEAQGDSHRLRREVDAVLVGAGTLRADDPLLTIRLPGYEGPQPRAVVLAGDGPLPPGARLWDRPGTLVVAAHPVDVPVETITVDQDAHGLPDLAQMAVELGERGLLGILVEGGARISSTLWRGGLVDRGVTYIGGFIAGGTGVPVIAGTWDTVADGRSVEILEVARIGNDVRIDWRPTRE